jgi:hypothetical protein
MADPKSSLPLTYGVAVMSPWGAGNALTPNLTHSFSVGAGNNTTVYSPPLLGLLCGTGGSISVQLSGDSAPITLTNLSAGQFLPLSISIVRLTGTTASSIVGFN